MRERVVVIGAGVGGLSAGAILAAAGLAVTVFERADEVGGKLRVARVGDRHIDAGPTVVTMRWALESVFEKASARASEYIHFEPLTEVARHHWQDGSALDLFTDVDRSAAAVAELAGAREGEAYRAFAHYSERIWAIARDAFVEADAPSATRMLKVVLDGGLKAVREIDAARTMWSALSGFFRDPRLVQLFGRYATYSGSSPFDAPATLNCIAHVEREGVYSISGGLFALARALRQLADDVGAVIRTSTSVAEIVIRSGAVSGVKLESGEFVEATHVIFNGDVNALAQGLLGEASKRGARGTSSPSLSAVAVAGIGRVEGMSLARHNVFFSSDYRREFEELAGGTLPSDPTLYVCAQDRDDQPPAEVERLFFVINAPPLSSGIKINPELSSCEARLHGCLRRHGLALSLREPPEISTPADFANRFPGSQGALYGPATTGTWSSLTRARARASIKGLYLAGGSIHPGPGVPMAALSGRNAARQVLEGLASTERWRPTATHGGTSMR